MCIHLQSHAQCLGNGDSFRVRNIPFKNGIVGMGQSLGQVQHVLAIETDGLGMATLKHQKVVILWGRVLALLLFRD